MSEATSRASERRIADRRRMRRPVSHEESWFGAFAPVEDTQLREEDQRGVGDSAFASGLAGDTAAADHADRDAGPGDDTRFLARQAARLVETGQSAFERIYRVFIGARAALGVALLAAVTAGGLFGMRPSYPAMFVSGAYAVLAIGLWLLPHLRPNAIAQPSGQLSSSQWAATIGADLVCFTALHIFAPGSSFNYVALLVLPVLMAGVLTRRVGLPWQPPRS